MDVDEGVGCEERADLSSEGSEFEVGERGGEGSSSEEEVASSEEEEDAWSGEEDSPVR